MKWRKTKQEVTYLVSALKQRHVSYVKNALYFFHSTFTFIQPSEFIHVKYRKIYSLTKILSPFLLNVILFNPELQDILSETYFNFAHILVIWKLQIKLLDSTLTQATTTSFSLFLIR
jgi:hypothetical protein